MKPWTKQEYVMAAIILADIAQGKAETTRPLDPLDPVGWALRVARNVAEQAKAEAKSIRSRNRRPKESKWKLSIPY